MDSDLMSAAWRRASSELNIRVEAPASKYVRGKLLDCVAYLPDFGSPLGTVVLESSSANQSGAAADGAGPFVSRVSGSYYHFDRDLFVATLNDWGWHGAGQSPAWYSGEPWTD